MALDLSFMRMLGGSRLATGRALGTLERLLLLVRPGPKGDKHNVTTKYPCWLTVLAILNLGLLATILRSQNNPRPGYTVQLHIHNYKNGSPDPANDQVQMIAVRSDGSSMWISRSVGDVSKGVAPMQEIVDLAKGLLIEIDHQAKISDIIPLSPTGAMRRKQLNSNRCPAMPGRPCIEGPVLLGFRTQVADISVPAPQCSP